MVRVIFVVAKRVVEKMKEPVGWEMVVFCVLVVLAL